MITSLPYDVTLSIFGYLPRSDIHACAMTCKFWSCLIQQPSFWHDLILRCYHYDLPGLQGKDYEFLRFLSQLHIVKPQFTVPGVYKNTRYHAGTNRKVIERIRRQIDIYYNMAGRYLDFLITKEKQAWLGGDPQKEYIANPNHYDHYPDEYSLPLKGRSLFCYSVGGSILQAHQHILLDDNGNDFITRLVNMYYSLKDNTVEAIHQHVLTYIIDPKIEMMSRLTTTFCLLSSFYIP